MIEIEGTKLSYCRYGQFVGAEDLPGHPLHIRPCDPVDALEDFVQRELAAKEYLLPSEVAHARRRRFKAEHNRDLELILRALQLGFRYRLAFELVELLDAQPYYVGDLVR